VPIREESRPLAGFYPDPEQRYNVHYAFAHRFLPRYVHENPRAFFYRRYGGSAAGDVPVDCTRFIHSRWRLMEGMFAGAPIVGETFRRITDLTARFETLNGQPVAVITMPVPDRPVGAYFVAVVLLAPAVDPEAWTEKTKARVLTLECTDPGPDVGALCEWEEGGRHAYSGRLLAVDREVFLAAVADYLKVADPTPAATFTPKPGSPGEIGLTLPAARSPDQPSAGKKPWWRFWG
jgi:hypothetical protein